MNKTILFIIILLFIFSLFGCTKKIMYEGEEEFLAVLDRLSKGQVPLETFETTDGDGENIYIFLKNENFILYLTEDYDLKVKEKSTGKIGEVLGKDALSAHDTNIQYFYSTDIHPTIYGLIDGKRWKDNFYNAAESYSSECRIISKDENVTILYIYYRYPGYDGDCLYLTEEAYDSLKISDDLWEKDSLWFNTKERKLVEFQNIGDIVGKYFYHYSPMSQRPETGRIRLLKENGIGFNEIRKIYDDLGLTKYFNEVSFWHIIPITYRLSENGLEQSIDKSKVYISNLAEGAKVDFVYNYRDEPEKPEFIGELDVITVRS